MTIPSSRAGFLTPALVSYLETESAPYIDNLKQGIIEWNYTSDVHSASLNPKGKVFIQKIQRDQRISSPYKTYEISTRLLISDVSESVLECLLLDWENLIVNDFMFRLSQSGFSGTVTNALGNDLTVNNLFLKIKLLQSNIYPRINQTKGGTGGVLSLWEWTDYDGTANSSIPFL